MKLGEERVDRICEHCKEVIKDRGPRARFCSNQCARAPRFFGTFCLECGEPLIVAPSNWRSTKRCSAKCRFLGDNPNYNENYFAVPGLINSYWAGLIAADGCIYQPLKPTKSKILSVKLRSSDESHLKMLQEEIGAGHIYDDHGISPSTGVTCLAKKYLLSSDKICDDLLLNYNIVQRKTGRYSPPDNLVGENAQAFAAGYIDGNGWYSSNNNRPNIGWCGSEDVVGWILSLSGFGGTIREKPNMCVASLHGDEAIKLRQNFIDLNLPLLDRKIDKWEEQGCSLEILGRKRREPNSNTYRGAAWRGQDHIRIKQSKS